MRTIFVSGHLGNDPEVKTTSNGRQFTTFRIANHEYNDPENVTFWYSVTVWDNGLQKWCQSLKKGSNVYVIGTPTDRTYNSTKTGFAEIGRDIRAIDVQYYGGARRDDDTQEANTVPAQAAPVQPASAQESAPLQEALSKKAPAKKAANFEPPAANEAADDDLPF